MKQSYISNIQNAVNECKGLTLDIGCGNRRFTSKNSIAIIRVDIDQQVKPEIISDIRFLPFRPNCFDSIYCIQTIGSFSNSRKAIWELFFALKTNGKLIMTLLRKFAFYRLQIFRNKKAKERFTSKYLQQLPFKIISCKSIDAFFPVFKNEFLLVVIK